MEENAGQRIVAETGGVDDALVAAGAEVTYSKKGTLSGLATLKCLSFVIVRQNTPLKLYGTVRFSL